MSKTREVTDDEPVDRLEYAEACDRANELRASAESYLEAAEDSLRAEGDTVNARTMASASVALALAIAHAILEVGARLELLELDAELSREEAPE